MRRFFYLFLVSAAFSASAQDSLYVLDLEEAINIAVENNLTVRRTMLQKEGARVNLRQSKAELLPSLNVGGSYGYNWGRSIDPTTNDFINQQITFSGVSGNASMTLFNWFRLANTVKQNKLQLESAEYSVASVQNDISLDIVTFYLNVIFNKELLENARYQLESSKEQLERTKKLVQGGALPRTNELELVSQVATNEVNVINAENNLNLAMLNLKQAMLIPVGQELELVVPDLDVDEVELDENVQEVYTDALATLPQIKSSLLDVESALMGVKIAEAAYAPVLSLEGGFRTNYSDAANRARQIFDGTVTNTVPIGTVQETGQLVVADVTQPNIVGEDPDFTFGEQFEENFSRSMSLNLSVPVFNSLRAKSNVQRAKIDLQIAEIALAEQKNLLRQTIEAAYNDALAAAKTYAASISQVEALEETFRSVENQYNLGAANFTDYQVGANNLFGARSDLVRAKFDYVFKKKILDFYQGESLSF